MTSVLLQLRINANTHTQVIKPRFSHCYLTALAWTFERNPLMKYLLKIFNEWCNFSEVKQGQVRLMSHWYSVESICSIGLCFFSEYWETIISWTNISLKWWEIPNSSCFNKQFQNLYVLSLHLNIRTYSQTWSY